MVVLFGTKMPADADLHEYAVRSQRMNELVREIPGLSASIAMPSKTATRSRSRGSNQRRL